MLTDPPPIFTPSGIAIVCEACPQPITPAVTQGRVYHIAGATGYVGVIVQPDRGGISIPGWGISWINGQADMDGNGWVNGDDIDYFNSCFAWGTAMADFDGNGWVNGDDADAFSRAAGGTP